MLKRLPVLAMAFSLAACSMFTPKFTKPSLSVVSVEMVHGNLLQQNFQVTFRIQNPNNRALPVKGLHADLNVAGEPFASGTTQTAFVVPANGDTEFDMMISANIALGLLKLANNMDKQSNSVAYDLTGVVTIDLPFVGDVPFHQGGTFQLK